MSTRRICMVCGRRIRHNSWVCSAACQQKVIDDAERINQLLLGF